MAATSPRRRPPDERHGEGDLSAHRAGLDRCPLLKNTKGLAGIDSIGGYVKQFQVIPDVQRLAAMGLTLTDLGTALERNNTSVGGGFVNRNGEGLAVRSDALVRNANELSRIVVATRNGTPITLGSGGHGEDRAGHPHGLGLRERHGSRGGHRHHADRREQPHGGHRRGGSARSHQRLPAA
jgi:hypothetical protein